MTQNAQAARTARAAARAIKQNEVEAALADRALIDPDHVAHPFAALHGRFTRVMALGQLGRIGDGLRACDDLERAVERAGAVGARFPAIAMNVRAWLLRGAERLTDADELNAAALERNAAPEPDGNEQQMMIKNCVPASKILKLIEVKAAE